MKNQPEAGRGGRKAEKETERGLIEGCVEALRELVHLDGWTIEEGEHAETPRVDARLELRLDGQRVEFAVEVKRWIRTADLSRVVHLAHQVEERGERLLVCAERIPTALGEQLREHGVAYLDLGGNAFLRAAGLHILITGRRAVKTGAGRRDLTGTDVRLLGVFLRDPDAGQLVQKQLAERAGIALGVVGRGREKLAQLNIVRQTRDGHWVVADREEGLRRFGEGWNAVLRHKLAPKRFRMLRAGGEGELERRLAARGRDLGARLGGELAAAHVTRWLQTEQATLHVLPGELRATAQALDLVPDPEGPITLLHRYGDRDEYELPALPEVPLAPLLLIWAECLTVPDERVAKTAQLLHEELMGMRNE